MTNIITLAETQQYAMRQLRAQAIQTPEVQKALGEMENWLAKKLEKLELAAGTVAFNDELTDLVDGFEIRQAEFLRAVRYAEHHTATNR